MMVGSWSWCSQQKCRRRGARSAFALSAEGSQFALTRLPGCCGAASLAPSREFSCCYQQHRFAAATAAILQRGTPCQSWEEQPRPVWRCGCCQWAQFLSYLSFMRPSSCQSRQSSRLPAKIISQIAVDHSFIGTWAYHYQHHHCCQ